MTIQIKHPRSLHNLFASFCGWVTSYGEPYDEPTRELCEEQESRKQALAEFYSQEEISALEAAILCGEFYLGCDADSHADLTEARLVALEDDKAVQDALERAFDAGFDAASIDQTYMPDPYKVGALAKAYHDGWSTGFDQSESGKQDPRFLRAVKPKIECN